MPTSAPRAEARAAARAEPRIIAALVVAAVLLATSACSMIKIGYGQAGTFAYRWLDGYVDFDDAQSKRVRSALDEWLAWHRRTQLRDYADLLARGGSEAAAPTTPERLCSLVDDVKVRLETALERVMPAFVELVPTLTLTQIDNIERRYAERNDEYRDDYLQKDPAKRRRAAVQREVERAETLYGRLDDAQRATVAQAVAESPFDGELAFAERQRRQQDALAMLRRLVAAKASRGDVEAEVRAYVARLDRSPRADYRAYSERLRDYNCAFAATLHNSTSIAQRRTAARKLKGYEDDLRSLAAEATG